MDLLEQVLAFKLWCRERKLVPSRSKTLKLYLKEKEQ